MKAAKHKAISQGTPHGAPLANAAEKLTERLLVIEYEDAQGDYRCTQKAVFATLADGTERNLLEVLTGVMNFWEGHLHGLGVLSKQRTFVFEPQVRHRTRAECENIRLDFQVVQGHRFKQSMQLLKFDSTTDFASPIDITGSQFKFRIYKPRFDFDVTIRQDATGKEYTKTVVLSDEENEALAAMSDDGERQAFAANLPAAQAALRELAAEAGLTGTRTES